VVWNRHAGADETRELLHARLTVYTRVTFVTYVALSIVVTALMIGFWNELLNGRSRVLTLLPIAGCIPVGCMWLYVRRRERTLRALQATDAVLALFNGTYLGSAVYLIPDHAPNVYLPFIFVTLVVFMRVLIVPSQGTRTLGIASLTVLPLLVAYAALARFKPGHFDVKWYVFLIGAAGCSVAVVALARVGSNVMYGLRRDAEDAKRLGQYTLEEKLGEGAMGEVYRASHAMLRRPTAIKLLKSDGEITERALARFEREVQLTSQLTSPHTIQVYDYGTTPDGRFYYVMEYLRGVDLERHVEARGALPPARVIHLIEQVCSALAEAHERGLIHRDIKPANIMVCELGDRRDVVKVFDFGLAKDLSSTSSLTGQLVAGTPAFLAPDMIKDPTAVTPATDLYAVGATAYFLLTGQLVFDGKTVAEVCMHHVQTAPRPVTERAPVPVPEELAELVMQCLAKTASARPPSARVMAQTLRRLATRYPWTEEDARAWWAAEPSVAPAPAKQDSSDAFSPVTMTVDLADRQSQSDQGGGPT